jgi:phosphoheptose isomerase
MTSKEYLKLLQSTLNEIDLQSVEKMKTIFLEAHEKGSKIYTMGNGGELKNVCDLSIHSPAMDMEIAEDIHMAVFNMVKKEVMSALMPKNASMGETYDNRITK